MADRPNYFLAIKLQDDDTVASLVDVQRQIVELFPQYRHHQAHGFHLTIQLLSLRSYAEIRRCAETMKRISNRVQKYMKDIEPLAFRGLGNFRQSVVFAKVEYTAAFMDLRSFISDKLKEAGVNIVSRDNSTPHVTLFKVPGGGVNPSILARFDDQVFGSQAVDHIHLCKMGTLRETSEFYEITASILSTE